jgi:beta-glucosidase
MLPPSLALVLATQSVDVDSKVDLLIKAMTLEEKVSLCHGFDSMSTAAVPRLGIPSWHFADGPHGVRVPDNIPATGFPTGVSMASTWNPELISQLGEAMGEEALAKGDQVMLGPAVCIVRTPIGGRSFEYMSEDPYLAGRIATGHVKGLQSTGVQACVKHFAGNSIELERGTVDDHVTERTLREIYLPAFEMAVKEGKAGSAMAAYNKVNGHYCAENKHLIRDILQGDWGFKGYIMSDWGAVHSTVATALDGVDLEMPGFKNNFLGDPLVNAVKAGEVPETVVDDKVRRFLTIMFSTDPARAAATPSLNTAAHQELAQKVAEQAMVLLKNDRHILPLNQKKLPDVVVIGPNADVAMSDGGGSSSVPTPFEITPLAGIKAYLGDRVPVTYVRGGNAGPFHGVIIPPDQLQTGGGQPGLTGEYFDNDHWAGSPALIRTDADIDFNWNETKPAANIPRTHFSVRWKGFLVPKVTGPYLIGVSSDDGSVFKIDGQTIVDNSGNHSVQAKQAKVELTSGTRYAIEIDYSQGEGGAEMHLYWTPASFPKPYLAEAAAAAKKAGAVILVIGTDHRYDTEGSDKPDLKLSGDQDELAEAVLNARPDAIVVLVNGTAVEMPWIGKAHAVLESWYGGMMTGKAISRILFGDVNPSGKLPITFPVRLADSPAHANGDYPPKNGVLPYDEGVFVGYRYYDAKNVQPLFPFGYGLSYTSFAYSGLTITNRPDGGVEASFKVKNTGRRDGMEIAEAYVEAPASADRPLRELKGFAKVSLKPGESQSVTLRFPPRAFSYWSDADHGWAVAPGAYRILVGSSSRDIRLHSGEINLAGSVLPLDSPMTMTGS